MIRGDSVVLEGINRMAMGDWVSSGLLLVTAYYAWLTSKISKANSDVVQAMRDQLIAADRPYLTIRVLVESILFRLEIVNTGRTAAEKVRLQLDRDFFQFGDARDESNIAKFNAFTNEIESLPPGASLVFHLTTAPGFFAEGPDTKTCPTVFSIKASYGFLGRRVEETTKIDIRPYLNSSATGDPLVETLKEIKDAIEKLAKD